MLQPLSGTRNPPVGSVPVSLGRGGPGREWPGGGGKRKGHVGEGTSRPDGRVTVGMDGKVRV